MQKEIVKALKKTVKKEITRQLRAENQLNDEPPKKIRKISETSTIEQFSSNDNCDAEMDVIYCWMPRIDGQMF